MSSGGLAPVLHQVATFIPADRACELSDRRRQSASPPLYTSIVNSRSRRCSRANAGATCRDRRHMSNCSLYELKNEILKFCLTNAVTQICTTNDKIKSPKILSPKD